MSAPRLLLTTEEVCQTLAVRRTTLWRLRRDDPTFPRPVAITSHRQTYVRSEIEEWVKAKIAERDGENTATA